MTTYRCSNPATWHPTLHTYQKHHHPPLAWRRNILAANVSADQSWWSVIPLCGICHDEYHTLLNAYVRVGGAPPYADRRTYSPFIQRLVAEAWARRPDNKPPYTATMNDDPRWHTHDRGDVPIHRHAHPDDHPGHHHNEYWVVRGVSGPGRVDPGYTRLLRNPEDENSRLPGEVTPLETLSVD